MEPSKNRPLENGFTPKYKHRRVSAKRDFPVGCGPNAIPVNLKSSGEVGDVVADIKMSCQSNDIVDVKSHSSSAEQTSVGGQVASKDIKTFTCVGAKDKYRMRRVSAVRHFPPHCGPSVSLLTEEERLMITATKLKNVQEKEAMEGMPQRECLDGPSKKRETILYSADRNDKGGLSPVREEVPWKNSDDAEKVNPQKLSQLTSNAVGASNHEMDGSPYSSSSLEEGEYLEDSDGEGVSKITPVSMSSPDSSESVPREIVDYSVRKTTQKKPSDAGEVDKKVVHCKIASPNCPLIKKQTVSRAKTNVQNFSCRLNAKAVAKKSIFRKTPGFRIKRKLKKVGITAANQHSEDETQDFEVNIPPLGPNSSGDVRDRVRDTLRIFHAVCRKLMQQEEARSEKKIKRFDLAAAVMLKQEGKVVNNEKQLILGEVPGVEVGDLFQYRVELSIVGVHRLFQAGIHSIKYKNGDSVAVSIVSSGSYMDDTENADVLIYTGEGGNVVGKKQEQPEDQKLKKGNLALKNSIDYETPVRVVRGWRDSVVDPHSSRPKMVMTYVYDGLYTVQRYWSEIGQHGKKVYRFELRRNPGQPELAWKELKKLKKLKSRPGVCVSDISGGKEPFGICAVNTLDKEKPPRFNYISKMVYPGWHTPIAPPGCDCKGKCSDSKICKCAARNDGEIPYTQNGALVEMKLLVYECGPHCKCPSSCYNRVSQRGIRYQLEIFKTKSRGWGVRPLTSIPSGGFICEYAGELLNDTEAEKGVDIDEYLFDIGKNLTESCMNPEDQALSTELVEDGGYTVDACKYGNVGRFINHSCRPNLYAQNVVYDHNDLKMPHIMLFAMENIPPLKELTYHYNYSIDQIHDTDGNIKVKKCQCGAAECTGRLY